MPVNILKMGNRQDQAINNIFKKLEGKAPMYYIRKYANCWAIHDDDTGASRPLTENEMEEVNVAFPCMAEEKLRSVFFDNLQDVGLNQSLHPRSAPKIKKMDNK